MTAELTEAAPGVIVNERNRPDLSKRLIERRNEIERQLDANFNQPDAAAQIGVSWPTYQKAESNSVFGKRSLWRFEKWLAEPIEKLIAKARRERRRTEKS